MDLLALTSLLLLTYRIHRAKASTARTTAESARRWGLIACVVCILTVVAQIAVPEAPVKQMSAARYLCAVGLLTPLIAVLGARNPGAGAWNWFVVLPLIVVLQWPSVSQLSGGSMATPMIIPTPTVIGFLFVLVMGAGNYFGTLNTTAMAIGSAGVILILLPVTEFGSIDSRWPLPAGSACLLLSSLAISPHLFRSRVCSDDRTTRHEELWRDFRDLYGIVWAKRVSDRFNQIAERERLAIALTLDGFRICPPDDVSSLTDQVPSEIPDRATEVLCWILKRFLHRPALQRYLLETELPEEQSSHSRK